MTRNDETRWVLKHVLPRRLGLLSDRDAARVDEALERDTALREEVAAWVGPSSADPETGLTPPGDLGIGHLPSRWIADWSRTQTELTGGDRILARDHLEHCEECAGVLVAMGFEPTLEPDPATEPEAARAFEELRRADVADGADAPAPWWKGLVAGVPARGSARLLRTWAVLGPAAAVVAMVLLGPPQGSSRDGGAANAPTGAIPYAVVSLEPTRGAPPDVVVRNGWAYLVLRDVPSSFYGHDARIEMQTDTGEVMYSERVGSTELSREVTLLAIPIPAVPSNGAARLVLTDLSDNGARVVLPVRLTD